MPFSMTDAEVLSDEVAIAVWIITSENVLWSMIELMSVQMLSPRVAFAATFVLAFKFLLRVGLHDSSALLGRLFVFNFCHGLDFFRASR